MDRNEETIKIQKNLNILCHGMTDFKNPMSIMNTSAILLRQALHMYSLVLPKEELQELLEHAQSMIGDELEETVYH